MTDFPIIFSAPMIRALLDGRKTMTRQTISDAGMLPHRTSGTCIVARYWPGDRLWVRESWRVHSWDKDDHLWIKYMADDAVLGIDNSDPDQAEALCDRVCAELDRKGVKQDERGIYASTEKLATRSPIYMPRWASRLTLIVTATKIERVQDISEEDAKAEGVKRNPNAVNSFASLWQSLHGVKSWAANPYVVAITFTVHHRNIDSMDKLAGGTP